MTLIRFVGATNVDRSSTACTLLFLDFQFKNTPCSAAHIHLGQIRECRSHEFVFFSLCAYVFFKYVLGSIHTDSNGPFMIQHEF